MPPCDTDPLDSPFDDDETYLIYEEMGDYAQCHARSEEEGWYYPDEDEPEITHIPWSNNDS